MCYYNCSTCCVSRLGLTSAYFLSTANTVLGNMTKSANPSNSSSVAAESDGTKLEDEMSKPLSNMFLILRSGRKPRDGGELGSGLDEEPTLTSTPSPKEMTTEDPKLSPDSAETDHLLLNVKKVLPGASTKSPRHDSEEKMEFTVLDLDRNLDSALDPHEPPTTVTPFPSHSLSETEFPTVDFFDTRSHGNELVPQSSPAHELQGHEPTAWAMPKNYDHLTPYEQTVSPASEEDTTTPDEFDDDLTTTPPPMDFHPHFPNPFIPPREIEPPTNHNKLGKSNSAECRVGSVLVNGTCKSRCDTKPNYCFNGGQCFVLEGTGVFCR